MKLKPTESLSPIEIEKDIFGFDEHKEIINAEIIGELLTMHGLLQLQFLYISGTIYYFFIIDFNLW